MNFVPLLDLYNSIAAQAPGLNEVSAIDELRRASRAFANASMVSAESVTTAVAIGNRFVAVDVVDSAVEPVGVLWIEYGTQRIDPITLHDIAKQDPAWRTRPNGTPYLFVQESPDEVTLIPPPSKAENSIVMRVAYQPTRTTDKIDETLVRHYEEGIIDGALYRILRMPNTEWFSFAAAQQAQERFEMAISQARADGERNLTLNVKRSKQLRRLA